MMNLTSLYRAKLTTPAEAVGRIASGVNLSMAMVMTEPPALLKELRSLAAAENDMRFDNRYCWIVYFQDAVIVRVRAYLDSALVARLFEENPIA
jgi:acyl-CoA hydrolase